MASSEGHSSLRASDGELPKYFGFIVMRSSIPKPIDGGAGKSEGERCEVIGQTFCILNLSGLITFACVSLARRLQLEASYQ